MLIFKNNIHLFTACALLFQLAGCIRSSPAPETDNSGPVYILKNAANYKLQQHLQILPDSEKGYTIEEIAQAGMQDAFVPFPDKTFEPKSHQVYWGKIQLENRLPDGEMHTEWVLNFSSTFTRVTLFRLGENGTWTSELNGTFVPAHQKNFVPTNSGTWFRLPLPPREVVTLYFRGESERSALPPTFHTYVLPLAVYYQRLVDTKAWNGLFAGLLLMMLLYNLIKFFIVKDRSYIYYSGYLLMVLVYTGYISNDLEDLIGRFVFAEHPAFFNLFKMSVYLGMMCWLAFIRSFLDLEHLLPKWDRYFGYVIWLGAPLILLFVFLAFRYNFSYVIDDRATLFYIALVTISGFLFVYPLYRTKDPKGYFIAAGIAVICLGFLLTLFSRVYQTEYTVDYLKICTLIEILIFSMGLAYRHRKQVEARQQADFALIESQLHQKFQQQENLRLREIDDFKSRFFTNITHEFRTPLTVILGMGEQLSNLETDRQKKNMLSLIRRNGESLLRLINQILDLAKLESQSLTINYIQGNILTYLKYIAESLHSLANAQNVMLRVESDQSSIIMDYDPERFLQIIHNLLSNAIKFTPSGGKVILRANLQDKWLHIAVSDSGAGIPADELPHLFERFFQAKNQEHASPSLLGRAGVGFGGTGIGLSLTRELVRAMGGDISVESVVGVGSTFLVKLPVTNTGAFSGETPANVLEDSASARINPPVSMPSGLQSAEASLPQILLIEDNPDVVEYLAACLQNSGDDDPGDHSTGDRDLGDREGRPYTGGRGGRPYQLDFAYNGMAGIEHALDNIPDLIVSDVMMPIKDGFEVLETLKNDERTSHIPIILLTAKADVQNRLAGLRRGADAYLAKPFHQEELLLTVANLLEQRRKLQAKYSQWGSAPGHSEASAPGTDPEDVFLQKIRSVVEANLADPEFEMPQLERALAMVSQARFLPQGKGLTGKSPSLFIRSMPGTMAGICCNHRPDRFVKLPTKWATPA
ncbi:MAG: response regulator [Lewinellaceae bacterium]|nr:response regulator [Lewinellaceae bacterium]